MDLIGAGFGDQVDGGGRVMAVPRRQRARFDLELLQGVRKRRRQVQVVERIVVRAPVHDERDAVGLPASHRDGHGGKILVRVQVAGRCRSRQSGQKDQLGSLPAVQRDLEHVLVVNHLTDPRVFRLDERGVRGHRHLLTDRANRQHDVDFGIRSDLQDDTVANVGVESLQDDPELIRSDRQVGQRVRSIHAGEHGARLSGVGLDYGDLGAGNRAAGRVADDAGQLGAGNRLCPGVAVGGQHQSDDHE